MKAENGSHIRTISLLRFLHSAQFRVTVYCFSDIPECSWSSKCKEAFAGEFPRFRLVLESQGYFGRLATKLKNGLILLFPKFTRRICSFSFPGIHPKYKELRSSPLTIFSYTDGATELNGIDLSRSIVETHDVAYGVFIKKYANASWSVRAATKFLKENAVIDHCYAVIAIQLHEAAHFSLVASNTKIICVPSYGYGSPVALDAPHTKYDIVFVGSENFLNVQGILRFLCEHESILNGRTVGVCGRVCESAEMHEYFDGFDNYSLLGFIEDLSLVYAQSRIAISPVEGTGMKIKVIDAIKHGKPVVASNSSIQGLAPGHEGCVFPEDKLTWILELDQSSLRELGEEAHAYYEKMNQTDGKDSLVDLINTA